MEYVWLTVGWVLVVAGIVGCVVPVLPGPVLSLCAILCLLPTAHAPAAGTLALLGALTAVATVLDYVVPAFGAKKFKCSRLGVTGCFVGTVVGLFFFPLGLLLGPFLGAVAGELLAGKSAGKSIYGGVGAFLGFLAGVFLKLAACSLMAIWFCTEVVGG